MSRLWVLALSCAAAACGGSPASPPAGPAADRPAVTGASDDPAVMEDGEVDAPEADADADETDPAQTGRELRYVMRPEGLVVEVEGATFKPRAKAIRVGGGWGVRVDVEASVDGVVLSLLEPKRGALAFAGALRRGEHSVRFTDKREGDDARFLTPGEPVTLTRAFPGDSGEKPLTRGDRLSLEVGLWGLGTDETNRRAVKRLFALEMEVGNKTPSPVISAPRSVDFPK